MISVEFDSLEPFAVGQEVSGRVSWEPPAQARAHALLATIAWRAEPEVSSLEVHIDRLTLATVEHTFPDGQPTAIQVPFRFRLPEAGPVTYHGRLMRIGWSVSVRIQTIGIRLNTDRIESFPFLVGPRLLGSQPTEWTESTGA